MPFIAAKFFRGATEQPQEWESRSRDQVTFSVVSFGAAVLQIGIPIYHSLLVLAGSMQKKLHAKVAKAAKVEEERRASHSKISLTIQ